MSLLFFKKNILFKCSAKELFVGCPFKKLVESISYPKNSNSIYDKSKCVFLKNQDFFCILSIIDM